MNTPNEWVTIEWIEKFRLLTDEQKSELFALMRWLQWCFVPKDYLQEYELYMKERRMSLLLGDKNIISLDKEIKKLQEQIEEKERLKLSNSAMWCWNFNGHIEIQIIELKEQLEGLKSISSQSVISVEKIDTQIDINCVDDIFQIERQIAEKEKLKITNSALWKGEFNKYVDEQIEDLKQKLEKLK